MAKQKYKLPIDIMQAGETVEAGTEVMLRKDQIEYIKSVASDRGITTKPKPKQEG